MRQISIGWLGRTDISLDSSIAVGCETDIDRMCSAHGYRYEYCSGWVGRTDISRRVLQWGEADINKTCRAHGYLDRSMAVGCETYIDRMGRAHDYLDTSIAVDG